MTDDAPLRAVTASEPDPRKASKRRRSASEEELRAFIEQSPVAVAMLDTEMHYVVASRRWMLDFFPGRQDVVGHSHYDLFPEIPQTWKDVHKAGLAGATTRAERDPFPRLDGSIQYISWEVRPWRNARGDIGGILIFSQDNTQEVVATLALEESAAIFRTILDFAPNALLVINAEGQIEMVNRQAEALFGYSKAQIMAGPVEALLPARFRPGHPALTQSFISGEGPHSKGHGRDVVALTAEGVELCVDVGLSSVDTPQGRKVMVSIIDLTERKAMEEQLRCKTAEAEAANRAKDEFLANMSHEIRTPLTTVIGFADLLNRQSELGETSQGFAKQIAVGGRTLLAIVNDILEYSRIEAGRISIRNRPTDVEELCREIVGFLEPQAAQKPLTLTFVLPGALPLLDIDPDRLKQVLLNLLGNGLKFTDRGRVELTGEYDFDNARLTLSVEDTGRGVPEELLPRLFQRFTQLDRAALGASGGAGLGLAISRALVQAMGGQIGVETKLGQGSRFWISLPAQPVARAGDGAALELEAWRPGEGLRILVADDHAVNRQMVGLCLGAADFWVSEAADGAQAVSVCEHQAFDLILMDINMPEKNGIEALYAIRSGDGPNRNTPALAFTADVSESTAVKLGEAGFEGVVTKPFALPDLIRAIAEIGADPEG